MTHDPDRDQLLSRHLNDGNEVPCNSCFECCKGPERVLFMDVIPEEDLTLYHIDWHMPTGRPLLRNKPNGDCYYLHDGKCSIYDTRPGICHAFDCRDYINSSWQNPRISAQARKRL